MLMRKKKRRFWKGEPLATQTYSKGVKAALVLTTFLTPVLASTARGNVVGTDMQNFNPITSGLDFVTVQSSETLAPGVINFGFFLNYAVNTLPYFDNNKGGRTKFNDSLLGGDLNVGIGLLDNWDVGLSIPQILMQDVSKDGYHGQFGDKGNTEVRFNSKFRLWGAADHGVAVVGTANLNRTNNNPFVGKDAGPTYNLELAADTTFEKVAIGANFGRRWRKAGAALPDAAPVTPLGDQWIASAAASYLFSSIDTKLIFEVFGSQPVKKESENSDRLAQSAEGLVGLKHDFTTSLAGHFGAGTELVNGRASPDYRIYTGLNYALGPKFSPPPPTKTNMAGPQNPAKDPFSGPPKAQEKIVIHDILFEFDSDSLVVGGADSTLKKLVDYLNLKPVFKLLVIEGHTDSVGTDEYNADLSRRRAQTIRKWLVEKFKLDPKKIQAVGKGKKFPIADNGNYQGRQLNRRVEFLIYRDMK